VLRGLPQSMLSQRRSHPLPQAFLVTHAADVFNRPSGLGVPCLCLSYDFAGEYFDGHFVTSVSCFATKTPSR
jgi:hypothetical protein